jgi:hypothetical protein
MRFFDYTAMTMRKAWRSTQHGFRDSKIRRDLQGNHCAYLSAATMLRRE